jgi:hypothetical protein
LSPRGALLGLSIAGAITLSITALLASQWVLVSLTGVGLLSSILLNNAYARALKSSRRPMSRVALDRLVALEILGAFVPPVVVFGLSEAGAIPDISVDLLWAVIAATVAGVMVTCFLSSLVDWYYVLPRRDGLIGPPPCKAPRESRWQRVTWFWSAHRFAAAVAVIASVYGIAIAVGLWLNNRNPELSSGIGGTVAGLLALVTFFGRKYLAHIRHIWNELYSPSPALGEYLETKVEGESVSGYVLNVSIERLDLLKENDTLTHVSHGDIAKRCQHNGSTALCRERCIRGNADATGRPPSGGHGGCLYETEERFLEDDGSPRMLVF